MKKLILKTGLLTALTILATLLLGWLCTNYDGQYVYRMMGEMYGCEENIDVVFLGSSHVYRSYDTKLADELLGQKTYNAGSSSQGIIASYYLLREICKYHDVKEVYFDTYYGMAKMPRDDASVYILSDYMRPGWNKTALLYQSGGVETLINGYFVFRRNSANYHLLENLKSRASDLTDYSSITYDNEEYRGDGFVYSFEVISDAEDVDFSACAEYDFSAGVPVSDYYLEYLLKIIRFCKERNIKLTLVDQPMPEENIRNVISYDNYARFFYGIAKENHIAYWNFNQYHSDLGLETGDYKDADHLNGKGAQKYTEVFCSLIQKDREEGSVQHLFSAA